MAFRCQISLVSLRLTPLKRTAVLKWSQYGTQHPRHEHLEIWVDMVTWEYAALLAFNGRCQGR